MKTYKEINRLLLEEGSYATARLQKVTFDLMKLVEEDKIESFGYRSNSNSGALLENNFVNINITLKKEKDMIVLGMFDHLDEFPKAQKIIPKEIYDKLEDINGYLSFANTHLKRDLPDIKQDSYFSINAANRLGGFKDNPVNLLPSFMDRELEPVKAKKLK